MKKFLIGLIIGLSFVTGSAYALSTFTPSQGGTGIGTATAGDINKCLVVSNNAPFTYTLGTCGSGGGSGDGTFSTTTYNGRLLQYPYTTLITSLDGNATTTSDFWFDPFISKTFFSYASSTAQTIANAFITKLGNLASAGFVKTSADGTLSVDTNSYLTGTGAGVTSVSGTYPIQSSGGITPTISIAFGTTTSNTWAGTQAFTNTANFNTWTNNGSATTTNLAISSLTGVLVGNGSTKPISVAVSGTDFKTINGNSILGSGDLTISGGTGLSSYDAWTHPLLGLSATTSQMLFGTTTANNHQVTIASSTAPQLSLSSGTGLSQWAFRNAGGNLYIATTTADGTSTTTTAVFEATSATTTVRNVIDEKTFVVGDGTNAITTGAYASVQVPYNAKIMEWSIVSDDSASTACSIVIDVWKDTYANYPPTVTDTITASAKPTLSSANKNSGSAGTWNSTITEGDFLKFNVDSVTSCTHVTLKLKLKRQ